jgi:hypothetical protein
LLLPDHLAVRAAAVNQLAAQVRLVVLAHQVKVMMAVQVIQQGQITAVAEVVVLLLLVAMVQPQPVVTAVAGQPHQFLVQAQDTLVVVALLFTIQRLEALQVLVVLEAVVRELQQQELLGYMALVEP